MTRPAARRVFLVVLALELVAVGIGLRLLAGRGPEAAWHAQAAGLGVLLMAVLAAVGYLLLDWGRARSQRAFMLAVFGALGGKVVVVGAAVGLALLKLQLPIISLLAGMIGAWVLFNAPLMVCMHRSAMPPAGGGTGASQKTV